MQHIQFHFDVWISYVSGSFDSDERLIISHSKGSSVTAIGSKSCVGFSHGKVFTFDDYISVMCYMASSEDSPTAKYRPVWLSLISGGKCLSLLEIDMALFVESSVWSDPVIGSSVSKYGGPNFVWNYRIRGTPLHRRRPPLFRISVVKNNNRVRSGSYLKSFDQVDLPNETTREDIESVIKTLSRCRSSISLSSSPLPNNATKRLSALEAAAVSTTADTFSDEVVRDEKNNFSLPRLSSKDKIAILNNNMDKAIRKTNNLTPVFRAINLNPECEGGLIKKQILSNINTKIINNQTRDDILTYVTKSGESPSPVQVGKHLVMNPPPSVPDDGAIVTASYTNNPTSSHPPHRQAESNLINNYAPEPDVISPNNSEKIGCTSMDSTSSSLLKTDSLLQNSTEVYGKNAPISIMNLYKCTDSSLLVNSDQHPELQSDLNILPELNSDINDTSKLKTVIAPTMFVDATDTEIQEALQDKPMELIAHDNEDNDGQSVINLTFVRNNKESDVVSDANKSSNFTNERINRTSDGSIEESQAVVTDKRKSGENSALKFSGGSSLDLWNSDRLIPSTSNSSGVPRQMNSGDGSDLHNISGDLSQQHPNHAYPSNVSAYSILAPTTPSVVSIAEEIASCGTACPSQIHTHKRAANQSNFENNRTEKHIEQLMTSTNDRSLDSTRGSFDSFTCRPSILTAIANSSAMLSQDLVHSRDAHANLHAAYSSNPQTLSSGTQDATSVVPSTVFHQNIIPSSGTITSNLLGSLEFDSTRFANTNLLLNNTVTDSNQIRLLSGSQNKNVMTLPEPVNYEVPLNPPKIQTLPTNRYSSLDLNPRPPSYDETPSEISPVTLIDHQDTSMDHNNNAAFDALTCIIHSEASSESYRSQLSSNQMMDHQNLMHPRAQSQFCSVYSPSLDSISPPFEVKTGKTVDCSYLYSMENSFLMDSSNIKQIVPAAGVPSSNKLSSLPPASSSSFSKALLGPLVGRQLQSSRRHSVIGLVASPKTATNVPIPGLGTSNKNRNFANVAVFRPASSTSAFGSGVILNTKATIVSEGATARSNELGATQEERMMEKLSCDRSKTPSIPVKDNEKNDFITPYDQTMENSLNLNRPSLCASNLPNAEGIIDKSHLISSFDQNNNHVGFKRRLDDKRHSTAPASSLTCSFPIVELDSISSSNSSSKLSSACSNQSSMSSPSLQTGRVRAETLANPGSVSRRHPQMTISLDDLKKLGTTPPSNQGLMSNGLDHFEISEALGNSFTSICDYGDERINPQGSSHSAVIGSTSFANSLASKSSAKLSHGKEHLELAHSFGSQQSSVDGTFDFHGKGGVNYLRKNSSQSILSVDELGSQQDRKLTHSFKNSPGLSQRPASVSGIPPVSPLCPLPFISAAKFRSSSGPNSDFNAAKSSKGASTMNGVHDHQNINSGVVLASSYGSSCSIANNLQSIGYIQKLSSDEEDELPDDEIISEEANTINDRTIKKSLYANREQMKNIKSKSSKGVPGNSQNSFANLNSALKPVSLSNQTSSSCSYVSSKAVRRPPHIVTGSSLLNQSSVSSGASSQLGDSLILATNIIAPPSPAPLAVNSRSNENPPANPPANLPVKLQGVTDVRADVKLPIFNHEEKESTPLTELQSLIDTLKEPMKKNASHTDNLTKL